MPTELPPELPYWLSHQFTQLWPVMQRYAEQFGQVPLRVGKDIMTPLEIVQSRDPAGLETYFNWLLTLPGQIGQQIRQDTLIGAGAARPALAGWENAARSLPQNLQTWGNAATSMAHNPGVLGRLAPLMFMFPPSMLPKVGPPQGPQG